MTPHRLCVRVTSQPVLFNAKNHWPLQPGTAVGQVDCCCTHGATRLRNCAVCRDAHQAKQVVVGDAGVSVRHMLQTLGTEYGRQCIHPDIWVRCWKGRAQRFDAVVADDVRFPNEAKMIKLLGGEMWRIDRTDAVRTFDHASEGSLDSYGEFDRYITNDGTIEDLISKLQDIPV
jgi:hypothetical protein